MKPKLFLIINSFYGGGAEHVASRLSGEFNKKYDLCCISLQQSSGQDYPFIGKKIFLKEPSSRVWPLRIKDFAKQIDELARYYNPITMISFLQNANLALAITSYKCRKIISVRNYLPRLHTGLKSVIWKFLIRKYYNNVNFVVSVSNVISESMYLDYGVKKDKCVTIYNPYNIDIILHEAKEPIDECSSEFYSSHCVISVMGNLSVAKGHYHLIRLLPELRKIIQNVGLVIIGKDKGYLTRLSRLAKDLGVKEHVYFTGHQMNPYKYVYRSDCFVFPSLWEGFPNALVEAMICGKPVIAANCLSGPGEILSPNGKDKYGILMPDDVTPWLDATKPLTLIEKKYIENIVSILTDNREKEYYSNQSLVRAMDFKIDSIVKQWFKIIE